MLGFADKYNGSVRVYSHCQVVTDSVLDRNRMFYSTQGNLSDYENMCALYALSAEHSKPHIMLDALWVQ